MAFDGCGSIKVPDEERNRGWLGKLKARFGAQVLARCTSTRRPPVLAVLPDGSYLTQIAGRKLAVIEAKVKVTGADGSVVTGFYRLVTSLTDHRADRPAH